jgi:hypothetical protein
MLKYILIFTLIATGSLNCMQQKTYGKTHSTLTTMNLTIPTKTQGFKPRLVNTTNTQKYSAKRTKKAIELTEVQLAALEQKYTIADKENLEIVVLTRRQEIAQGRVALSLSDSLTNRQKNVLLKEQQRNGFTMEAYNDYLEANTFKNTLQSPLLKTPRTKPCPAREIYGTPMPKKDNQ